VEDTSAEEGWMDKKNPLPGNQTVLFESISSPPLHILHDQIRYISTFVILYTDIGRI
jgi:hypothetical protein